MIINNVRGVTSALFLSELAARTQLSLFFFFFFFFFFNNNNNNNNDILT